MFDPNTFLKKKKQPTVFFPCDIMESGKDLYGYYHSKSRCYNITGIYTEDTDECRNNTTMFLGHIHPKRPKVFNTSHRITAYYEGKNLVFETANNEICKQEPYQLKTDLFSRNSGILESDCMLGKGAIIIGCGSVGSLVALELARSGVGRFYLIDGDIMCYHNICRHQCGISDVGKYKVDAVKQRILQINPKAIVETSTVTIQEAPLLALETFINPDTIMIGCADNREGDLFACEQLAKPNGIPFISIGCWERAFAGEIFYCLPEGMPTYADFVSALGANSGRVHANTHLYMGEVGSFEPGISVDINFVTIIAIKIVLDLLNRNDNNYTQRVLPSLSQYTLICNTNNPKIGGDMAEIFSYPLQITTNIEVDYSKVKAI